MSIAERLQMVIKMNGLTNASFADKIGVQRSSVSHVLSGRNKPSVDFIQKILITFPRVDANWLVTGKKIGRFAGESPTEPIVSQETNAETVKEEDGPIYFTSKNVENKEESSEPSNGRTIKTIIVYYTDGTYEEWKR